MELSAYFYGAIADTKNPKVPFTFSKTIRQHPKWLSRGKDLTLEIRVKNTDIGALFAFSIAKDGSVMEKDNIAVVKDENNRILWHTYGYPIHLIYRSYRGFYLGTETENHLYIFCLLPETNKFEVYKAEVNLTGEGGLLLWQKVYEGCCFLKDGWRMVAGKRCCEEWPLLAELLEFPSFQKKFKPYIWAKQIPEWKV